MADTKISALTELTTPASVDLFAIVDDPGGTPISKKITFANIEAALSITESQISDLGTYLTDIVNDLTPQLGGNLDVNGNSIVSTSNGNITLAPNGTGNVTLGNFTFDADQTVGAGQDNYVLTYDNSTGLISLEASAGGGGGGAFTADGNSLISPATSPTLDQATGNEVAFTLDYTVNKATSGNDTGLLVSMTDTASPGTSLLADFQVGGTSQFKVNASGNISTLGTEIFFNNGINCGIGYNSSNVVFKNFGDFAALSNAGVFKLRSTGSFAFVNSTSPDIGTADTILARDAANTLALRNSTNAQTFNIYNTYTDASNYERIGIYFSANDAYLNVAAAGTGTQRDLRIEGPTTRFAQDRFVISSVGGNAAIGITSNKGLGWTNSVTNAATNNIDTHFARLAAGSLALRTGTPGSPSGFGRFKAALYDEAVNAIGSTGGGTQDIDLTLGQVVTATVDTSANTFTFSNPAATGTASSFTLILTNGGSQTVNWPASVDWAGGVAPTLTASGVDVITFTTVDGGTTWYGFPAGINMS